MLAASDKIKAHEEISLERGKHLAHLDSGNPFMPGQDFIYSKDEKQHSLEFYGKPLSINDASDSAVIILNKNIELSKRRLNRHPRNPNVINSLALNYQKVGDIENAIKTYDKSLEIDPDFFATIANLSKCYTSIGRYHDALALYKTLEKKGLNNEVILENIGILYLKLGKSQNALEYFNKAKDINEKNHSVWNNIGLIQLSNNEIDKAISSLRKAYNLKNDDPNIINNVGVSFAIQGNLKKAINYFNIANKLRANDRNTLMNLAMAYQLTDQFDKVIDLITNFINIREDEIELRNILAWAYFNTKKYDKALGSLKRAFNFIDPKKDKIIASRFLNNIGVIYDHIGQKNNAEKLMLSSIELCPNEIIINYCNLIHLYFSITQDEKAKNIIDQAATIFPDDAIFTAYLGEYYFRIGEYDLSKEYHYSVIESNPDILIPYATLTTILSDIDNNPREALKIIENVYPHAKDNLQVVNNYAYILIQLGKIKKARLILDAAATINDTYLAATNGLLLIIEGKIEEGRAHYNRAKKLAGSNRDLMNMVEKKKQLELGKYYFECGDTAKAKTHLQKGLDVKTNSAPYYDKHIIDLLNHILVSA